MPRAPHPQFDNRTDVSTDSMAVKRNILVSFSGGRSSAYMAKRIREHPDYRTSNFLFCYANTGKERQETLDFVDRCDKEFGLNLVWVEAKIFPGERKASSYTLVDYKTASRNGEPFETVIQKYGIPNQKFPHCTRELKLNPIHAFTHEYFKGEDYISAIGIRVDEARRIKISSDKCYPLVEWGVNVETVRNFWLTQSFDLQLKDYEGNCDLCWKKSLRKLMTLVNERPQDAAWWADMEARYSHQKLPRHLLASNKNAGRSHYFGRKSLPIVDLIEMAKQNDFTPVTDPYWQTQTTPELDDEQPCACMLQDYEIDA